MHSICDRVRYLKKTKTSSRKLFAEVCICIRQSIEFMFKAINWFLRYGQGLYILYTNLNVDCVPSCTLCMRKEIMPNISLLIIYHWLAELKCASFNPSGSNVHIFIFWYDRETLINELIGFFLKALHVFKKKPKLILAKHLDDTEAVLVELMTYNFKKWIIRSVPGNSISENGTVRRLHGISCQSQ